MQNRESPVDEFDMHPIDQKRRLPQLYQRAEAKFAQTPAAPRIGQPGDGQKDAYSGEKEVRARVPVVVHRVQVYWQRVQPGRQEKQSHACRADQRGSPARIVRRPFSKKQKSGGESGDRKGRPAKDRLKRSLRALKSMDAADV